MIKITKAIIVEGKYDKIKLESFIDAFIIATNGFAIFKDKEQRQLIKTLAAKTGIIILTDSDAAGFKIRSHIKSFVPPEQITNIYIPDLFGKEKRKTTPSKEGKIGVEGIDKQVLLAAFKTAEISDDPPSEGKEEFTKLDLYELGLSGKEGSFAKRKALIKALGLPERMSAAALITYLNIVHTKEEILTIVNDL